MSYRRRIFASSAIAPLLLLSSPSEATYSIAATDQATRAVGAAVTSCVGASGVTIVYGPAPGFGAINAQATVQSTANRDRGVQLLQMGTAPADIIQDLTTNDSNGNPNVRQYGVVDLQGRAAGFTGSSALPYAKHLTGTISTFTYAVQGNILTGHAVLSQAETAFRNQGCDLAEKLMLALEGGAQNGQGDTRCMGDAGMGVPGNAAMIEVDLPGQTAGSYLRLTNAQASKAFNAVTQLRSQFDTWRQTHPCMQPDGGAPDAGSKDATVSDMINDRPDAADVSIPPDASDGGAGTAGTGGTAGAAGSSGTGGTAGAAGTAGTAGKDGGAGTGGATGGASGSAGASGASGSAGKGGAGGTAGSGGSGGSGGVGTGGATGTGGSGATAGSGGASGATAGTSSTGGRGGSGGSSGAGSGTGDDGGCSCRLGQPSTGTATFVLSGLALIGAARSRRSKRRR